MTILFPGAYCYAELGCMITKSGADYAYIMVTFGPMLAFVRIWIECMIGENIILCVSKVAFQFLKIFLSEFNMNVFLVRPCTLAIQALTFSIYILKPLFSECDPPEDSTR